MKTETTQNPIPNLTSNLPSNLTTNPIPNHTMNTTPHADLINALAEMQNVSGNKLNPHFKSKYVSLDALLDAVKPVLHKHRLAFIQELISEESKIGVQTKFLHQSGHGFDFGRLMINSSNLDAQKIGAALTYIRRQSIQTACGISIDQDDDGNSLKSKVSTIQNTSNASVVRR